MCSSNLKHLYESKIICLFTISIKAVFFINYGILVLEFIPFVIKFHLWIIANTSVPKTKVKKIWWHFFTAVTPIHLWDDARLVWNQMILPHIQMYLCFQQWHCQLIVYIYKFLRTKRSSCRHFSHARRWHIDKLFVYYCGGY